METHRLSAAAAALVTGALMACSQTTGQTGIVVSVSTAGPVDCVVVAASKADGDAVQAPIEVPDPGLWRDARHRVLVYAGGALGEGEVELSLTGHRGACDSAPVARGQASSRFQQGQIVEVAVTLALTGNDADGDGYADAHDCAPNNPLIFPRPGDEKDACDGFDNDCDGDVDEGCPCTEPRPCYPLGLHADVAGVGRCELGEQACVAGQLGSCQGAGLPAAETCDGVDNDCDGIVDPDCDCDPGQTRACYGAGPARAAGVGACQPGSQVCVGNRFGPCVGDVAPAREICNDVDDDCDGEVDEDARPERCALTEGVCAGATRACDTSNDTCGDSDYERAAASRGTSYVPVEMALHCDGADNDCDGEIDEGCTCRPGQLEDCHPMGVSTPASATGQCRRGTRRCTPDGVWGACQGYVAASPEICDGVDNDCDGTVDDSVEGEDEPCATGQSGVCSAGVNRCVDARLTCVSLEPSAPETCNGRDDDCDGDTDEDFDRLSDPTHCGSACVNCGTGSACCNGTCTIILVDDAHCGACGAACGDGKSCCQGKCFDFQVDNRHCGACGVSCANGNLCRAGRCVPSTELACHDGEDDDADGMVDCADSDCDEGASCGAPGAPVAATCQSGECVAESESSCSNRLDDDRNGDVDCADEACGEGVTCDVTGGVCCKGACAHETVCGDGFDNDCDGLIDCEDPDCAGKGPAELCNGRDDDCDGAVDEDFDVGKACAVGVGACREESQMICISAKASQCKADPGPPSREICNEIDDDCDGETDEAPACGGPGVDVAEGASNGWTVAESTGDLLAPCRQAGTNAVSVHTASSSQNVKAGANSIRVDYTGANYFQGVYPANRDADWDLSTRTGVHFWVRAVQPNDWGGWVPGGPTIILCSPGGHAILSPPSNLLSTTWLEVSLPFAGATGWTRTQTNGFDPSHVDFIEFHSNPMKGNGKNTANVFLDDVRFY